MDSVRKMVLLSVTGAHFEEQICKFCEAKTRMHPAAGLQFLNKIGWSLSTDGKWHSPMKDESLHVLLTYVLRILRAMDFESCDTSWGELRSTLDLWARLVTPSLGTSHRLLTGTLIQLIPVVLVQVRPRPISCHAVADNSWFPRSFPRRSRPSPIRASPACCAARRP